MSISCYYYEDLTIDKTKKGAAVAIKALQKYIQQFSEMEGISDLIIVNLRLETDEKKFHAVVDFNILDHLAVGKEYGHIYWSQVLEENEELLKGCVTYKARSYSDYDNECETYKFDEEGYTQDVPFNASAEDMKDADCWFAYSFVLYMDGERAFDGNKALKEKFVKVCTEFANKYNFGNLDIDLEDIEVNNEVTFDESLIIDNDKIDEFFKDLKNVIAFAKANGIEADTYTYFYDISSVNTMKVSLEKGKLDVKYCAF